MEKFKTIEEVLKERDTPFNKKIRTKFIDNHVHCNVTHLTEPFLDEGNQISDPPFTVDEIDNYTVYPEYFGTHAKFPGGSQIQLDNEIKRLDDLLVKYSKEYDEKGKDRYMELLDDLEELGSLSKQVSEASNWWAVSEFLYNALKEEGQTVVLAGALYLWGRVDFGQPIASDSVIHRICAKKEFLEGQKDQYI